MAQEDTSQFDKGTPPQHTAGISAIGSYMSIDLGTVNLSNGSLNFQIPLGQVGGRGFSLPITLNYSSKLWSSATTQDVVTDPTYRVYPAAYAIFDDPDAPKDLYQVGGSGWTIGAVPVLQARGLGLSESTNPSNGCTDYLRVLVKLTLVLPDKGQIELRDDATDGAPLGALANSSGCRRMDGNRGTRWHATDGSGIIFINDVANGVVNGNLNGWVITSEGVRYRFSDSNPSPSYFSSVDMKEYARAASVTDRNGNQVQLTYTSSTVSPYPSTVQLTDQLGRISKIQRNVPDPTDSTTILAVLVTLPGYDGATQGPSRYFKIKKGVMNQNYRAGTNPQLPVINGDAAGRETDYTWPGAHTSLFPLSYGGAAERIDDRSVVTELVLPDARSLRFKYNEFGEVSEVQMPTGGKVQYDYAYDGGLPSGNSPSFEVNPDVGDVHTIDRAVVTRRAYPNGTTLESTWSYSYTATSTPLGEASNGYTDVQARSAANVLMLNERHLFLAAKQYRTSTGGTGYSIWSTGVERRTETRDAAGAVMNASEQDWSQRTPVAWTTGYPQEQPANDNRVNESRRILSDGKVARVATLYDQYNNPTQVSEYDFDTTLERRTTTSYLNSNTTGGVTYNYQTDDAIRLLRLPAQQSVYDSVGVERARAVYAYDNYTADGNNAAMLDYGVMTGHDSAYGVLKLTRGNATRIGRWLNTTNTIIYSYTRYDEVGNIVSVKDARGNVSTISYTDDYGNGASPGSGASGAYGATYALPTLITSPAPVAGQPAHTARSQYDFNTGLLTGFKDRNSIVTQSIYDDEFNRPTLVKTGLGLAVETHSSTYYAPATAFGITLTNNDVLTTKDLTTVDDGQLRSWTRTDGFGRTTEQWSEDPSGDVKVVTVYDALGRARQTSNPFRPSSQTAAYTTSVFDLAGRVTSVTTPDNSVVSTAYNGNVVTVTDQAGKDRQSTTDALGRLTQVVEDPGTGGLAYSTTYVHDVLDNLTTVTQGTQTRSFVFDSLKRLTSAVNPESGTTSYLYDNNDNLTRKTDARLIQTNYSYDALNRVTLKNYSDTTPDVNYYYDAQALPSGAPTAPGFNRGSSTGKLVGVTYAATSAGSYYGYDALGRTITRVQRTDSVNYTVDATYNKAGGMLTETYPLVPGAIDATDRRKITYSYDAAGRMSALSSAATSYAAGASVSSIGYAAHGGLSSATLGNLLVHSISYNNRLQPTAIKLGTVATPTSVLNLIYNYGTNNNNGNLQYVTNQIGTSTTRQTYTYDALNRLSSTQETNGSTITYWTQTNGYDRYGNKWEVISGSPTLTFNTQNRIVGRSYDAAGNLLGDGNHTYTYDAENRIITVDGASDYRYDGEGRRVRKLLGENLRFVYDMTGRIVSEFDAAGEIKKEYIYATGAMAATIEPAVGTRYATVDHLGTPRVVTDSTGDVISRHDYKPFGEELFIGSAGSSGRTALQGYDVADGFRKQFTGKERDVETGLDYFGARFYASEQGRFTSADPVKFTNSRLYDPQRINLYSHCRGNPLKFLDPDGRDLILANNTAQERARTNIDASLRANERENIRIDGNRVVLDVKNAISDPSPAYSRLVGIIQSTTVTRYFALNPGENATLTHTTEAGGRELSQLTYDEVHQGSGATVVYDNGDRDVIVPVADDMSVEGTDGDPIPFPEFRSFIHEMYCHVTGQESEQEVIGTENQIGRSLTPPLPERSGNDHKLPDFTKPIVAPTTRIPLDPVTVEPVDLRHLTPPLR